jgi:hypothetical protein
VGFEATTPAFERAETVHVSDSAVTVMDDIDIHLITRVFKETASEV